MQYLIDTDICIFYMKGIQSVEENFLKVGRVNCYISEITLAELKFGAENSGNPVRHRDSLSDFLAGIQVLPIIEALDIYAREKTRLRKVGFQLDEFDILIGSTALVYNLTMVTNNQRHFKRIEGLRLENWINL